MDKELDAGDRPSGSGDKESSARGDDSVSNGKDNSGRIEGSDGEVEDHDGDDNAIVMVSKIRLATAENHLEGKPKAIQRDRDDESLDKSVKKRKTTTDGLSNIYKKKKLTKDRVVNSIDTALEPDKYTPLQLSNNGKVYIGYLGPAKEQTKTHHPRETKIPRYYQGYTRFERKGGKVRKDTSTSFRIVCYS